VKQIDSQALAFITKALGLTGSGAPVTELEDGHVDQVLDIVPIVRRSRTLAQASGLYYALIQNVHTAAETLSTDITPWAMVDDIFNTWSTPIPDGFDIWITSATVRVPSGVANYTEAALFLELPATAQAIGRNDSGAPVAAPCVIPLGFWSSADTVFESFGLLPDGTVTAPLRQRLPRDLTGTILRFISISSGIVTIRCQVQLGLFPVSLGQDAAF